ncbi:MAG: hypothetical protein QXW65_00595 [Candidatus Pacearchaeota archaeon]
MKIKILLVFFVLAFVPLAYAQTIQELSQSFMFNLIVLFLVVFFVCWFVLKDVFSSTQGAAILISLALALGGSFGVLSKYGPIVTKLDAWVFLLLVGLAIFVLKAILKPARDTAVNLILFAIPLAWFLFVKDRVSYAIPSNLLKILDALLGIFLVIAILMFVLALLKPKEQPRFFVPS